jgi:hypothetical protein
MTEERCKVIPAYMEVDRLIECPACGWVDGEREFDYYSIAYNEILWRARCPNCGVFLVRCNDCKRLRHYGKGGDYHKRGFRYDGKLKVQRYSRRCRECDNKRGAIVEAGYNHAHRKVQSAVRKGKLPPIKQQKCVCCNEQADYYHHYNGHDAANVLSVVPTCRKCHDPIERLRYVTITGKPLVGGRAYSIIASISRRCNDVPGFIARVREYSPALADIIKNLFDREAYYADAWILRTNARRLGERNAQPTASVIK